jgi:hypothetical protein
MKPLILSILTGMIISGCATPSSEPTALYSYNNGYNSVSKTCNDLIYYSKRYSKTTDAPTSGASTLWGLITTADVGYANSIGRLSGQKDAIAKIKPLPQRLLYSQAEFLNRCNFNPNYAQYCKSTYKAYMSGYEVEVEHLKEYSNKPYITGFNDAANNCSNQLIARPPIEPLELK